MTIIYEINPPKIPEGIDESSNDINLSLDKLEQRASEIGAFCDGIHITDSVLGTKRVSPLRVGKILKERDPNLQVTISMRVRDRDMETVTETVRESIELGLDGILVLKGDPSKENPQDSGLMASKVVKELNEAGFSEKIDFFLSLPSNPDFNKIHKKIEASPTGFMTQVIHSVSQVKRISERLRPDGFRVIPCILLPSEKNKSSAHFLNLDWSEYKEDPARFIREIHHTAGDVLITSPSDFAYAKDVLKKV